MPDTKKNGNGTIGFNTKISLGNVITMTLLVVGIMTTYFGGISKLDHRVTILETNDVNQDRVIGELKNDVGEDLDKINGKLDKFLDRYYGGLSTEGVYLLAGLFDVYDSVAGDTIHIGAIRSEGHHRYMLVWNAEKGMYEKRRIYSTKEIRDTASQVIHKLQQAECIIRARKIKPDNTRVY